MARSMAMATAMVMERINKMNYLKIRNFGPVKDATIELKPFLVLTGGQGTGKSTIAKLLCIFQDYYWYVSILEDNDTVDVLFLEYGISEYFNKNTYIEYSCNDIFITYQDSHFSFMHREILEETSCCHTTEIKYPAKYAVSCLVRNFLPKICWRNSWTRICLLSKATVPLHCIY